MSEFNNEDKRRKRRAGWIMFGSFVGIAGSITAITVPLVLDKDDDKDGNGTSAGTYEWNIPSGTGFTDLSHLYETNTPGEYTTDVKSAKGYVASHTGSIPTIDEPGKATSTPIVGLTPGTPYDVGNWHEIVDVTGMTSADTANEDEIDVMPFGETNPLSAVHHKVNTFGESEDQALWKVKEEKIYPLTPKGQTPANPDRKYFLGYEMPAKFDHINKEDLSLTDMQEIMEIVIGKGVVEIMPTPKLNDNPLNTSPLDTQLKVDAASNKIFYKLKRRKYLSDSDMVAHANPDHLVTPPGDATVGAAYPASAVDSPADQPGDTAKTGFGAGSVADMKSKVYSGTPFTKQFLNNITGKQVTYTIDSQAKYTASMFAFLFNSIDGNLGNLGHTKDLHGWKWFHGFDMSIGYSEVAFQYGSHYSKVSFSYNDVDLPEASFMSPEEIRFHESKGGVRPKYTYRSGHKLADGTTVNWEVFYHGVRLPGFDFQGTITAGLDTAHQKVVPTAFLESQYHENHGDTGHMPSPAVIPAPTSATDHITIETGTGTVVLTVKP